MGETINEWKAGIVLKQTPCGPSLMGKFQWSPTSSPGFPQKEFDWRAVTSTFKGRAEAGLPGSPSRQQNRGRSDMLMSNIELTSVDRSNDPERRGRAMRASLARLWSFLLIAGGLVCCSPAEALDVERIEWGFDGHVVPMVFNLVTIEVRNNTPTPFEGDVTLQEGSGVIRTDLPLIERQLYIEPYGSRRLQYFPFITEQYADFTLVWGDEAEERFPVSSRDERLSATGPRSVVLLRDASTSRQLRSKLPTFDEADFPISARGNGCGSRSGP